MLAALVLLPIQAFAYDVVNLPHSMTFSDALGIYDVNDIASATIADLENNTYKNLNATEIKDFYYAASNVTVWRKVNPTPFRGVCVNFTTTNGTRISYYLNAGIQIGLYGTDNYICYMPAKADAQKLSYIESEFYDSTEGVYGGGGCNVCNTKDFLKLPDADWAKTAISNAAANSLVPYEFTSKYGKNITREEISELMANLIAVAGNYESMEAYMKATGTVYLKDRFEDCSGRSEAIDQLFALGIVTGRTDTTFEPDSLVTRQELAVFMTRAAEQFMYIGTNYKIKAADASGIGSWASFHVAWNLDKGIMTLDDSNKFYPNDYVTTEQAITTANRLFALVTDWDE
jgi:hypothetical protein